MQYIFNCNYFIISFVIQTSILNLSNVYSFSISMLKMCVRIKILYIYDVGDSNMLCQPKLYKITYSQTTIAIFGKGYAQVVTILKYCQNMGRSKASI